jgi:hypothetical protein
VYENLTWGQNYSKPMWIQKTGIQDAEFNSCLESNMCPDNAKIFR